MLISIEIMLLSITFLILLSSLSFDNMLARKLNLVYKYADQTRPDQIRPCLSINRGNNIRSRLSCLNNLNNSVTYEKSFFVSLYVAPFSRHLRVPLKYIFKIYPVPSTRCSFIHKYLWNLDPRLPISYFVAYNQACYYLLVITLSPENNYS